MSLAFERVVAQPVPDHAQQHMVRMRDGVRLATDVYRAGSEPGPTVLVRLPYDKNSRYVFFDKIAERFTARGYVMVVQDVRGKFRSEGDALGWTGEVDDGFDTIEWVTRQSWSNGVVGMFGDSYYGFTQWSAVSSQHPALRAIVPRVTTIGVRPGLATYNAAVRQPGWLEGVDYQAHIWVDNETYEYEADLTKRPLVAAYDEAFEAIGKRSAGFDLAVHGIELEAYNGPHPYDARPVPVLHCVGWFDNLGAAHMRDYQELAKRPGWAAVQYLNADAIDHENYFLERAPVRPEDDHMVDDAALRTMLDAYATPALDFFDVFLKGEGRPDQLPRVRWKLGHVGWRTSPEWPPPGASLLDLHLAAPAAALASLPGGSLAHAPDPGEDAVSWRYDPDDLVPSAVPNTFMHLHDHPDESATADRDDVLVFTGPPLKTAVDLAGPASTVLYAESTAPTFDLFVRLLDVDAGGAARLILRGCVQADAPGRWEIDLGHTGYRVRAGHRLALLIAGSDFPNHVPNSGSTENPWLTATPKASVQTLKTGSASPSRLRLTVLPATPDASEVDER